MKKSTTLTIRYLVVILNIGMISFAILGLTFFNLKTKKKTAN